MVWVLEAVWLLVLVFEKFSKQKSPHKLEAFLSIRVRYASDHPSEGGEGIKLVLLVNCC